MISPHRAECSRAATPYTDSFYSAREGGSLQSARVVVPLVAGLVQPRSVVDIGCGLGTWLKAFVEHGITDCLGLDGDYVDRSKLLIPAEKYRAADLAKPLELGRTFDLAVCLEVAEHLPPRHAIQLIRSLTALAPCVLFSAAAPGQGGTQHVNEQWPSYWRKMFSSVGYSRLDPIRPQIWRNRSVDWWYRQNIYLYCKSSYIDATAALREEAEMAEACPFELVHEDVFGPLTTFRGLTRNWISAARRVLGRPYGRGT